MSSSKIMANSLDDSVFNGIAEMMQELKTDIATMKESLATKSDLTALQNAVANSVGAVKSVQRGYTKGDNDQMNVTISNVDMSKSFVLYSMDISNSTTQAGSNTANHCLAKLTASNKLTVLFATTTNWGCHWEVVEMK